uniref:RING-type domain-containing protein n=1 Tax=Opuntia streptacantha TaxID=393608 RepID=A0A7C9DEK7_OPUST
MMSGRRHAMSWRRVAKSLQALAAHSLLLFFTLLLVLKLDHTISCSWWVVFSPIWVFHAVVARGRFSLPAPSVPHDRHWAPCHVVVATPLIIAFELLLCVYLESLNVYGIPIVSLKIVFFPLLAFETIILIDNFRMCRALMPGDEESLTDEAIWETLPHFWVAISMVFFVAATLFTLLKLSGDIGALGWWDLFINFGIAECFAFLVCTKWSNPMIHRNSHNVENSPSSSTVSYLDWTSGLVVCPEEEQNQDRLCGLPDIGGHIMKIPIIAFQVLLCMYLEGTPASARHIPLPVLFSPLFVLEGVGVLFAGSRLVEKIVRLLHNDAGHGGYFSFSAKVCDCLAFMHHGSRLLGWWSIDEGSREEQARLLHDGSSGYNTFCSYPPEIVKKMPKKELAEEVWRLQAALGEQTEITKFTQQEYERLQHEKVLCRVCFEREINVVLLPCRHRTLCSVCCEKCKKCPVCRVSVEERMHVFDV